jgi:hypothetical protein
MGQHRFDRTETSLLWSGRYLFRYFFALITLLVVAGANIFPALNVPAFHIGGPVLLAGFALWRAWRAAARDDILWLARINLLGLVLLGALVAMVMMTAWHENRLCEVQPRGKTCTDVPPPIIRLFDSRRPTWNPNIPANP